MNIILTLCSQIVRLYPDRADILTVANILHNATEIQSYSNRYPRYQLFCARDLANQVICNGYRLSELTPAAAAPPNILSTSFGGNTTSSDFEVKVFTDLAIMCTAFHDWNPIPLRCQTFNQPLGTLHERSPFLLNPKPFFFQKMTSRSLWLSL